MLKRHHLAGVIGACSLIAISRAQQPPNVLLVTLDTVRADRLGAYGYAKAATPALDRLAREGIRFADATAQAPLTGPAHAAILTGRYPARLGVRDNAATPIPPGTTTAATLFKARGYRTAGFVGAFILGSEYGFAQGFDTFDATFRGFTAGTRLQAQRRCTDVADAATRWLESGTQPFFAWVHFYDAHAPYDPPPPFRARFASSPYDGEIAYVDSCVARLVATLERIGQLERTVIAAVGDHGEGLGEHGEAEHGLFLYDSVLHVPWILRRPGREGAGTVVDVQVRALDVLPTLAAAAGIPIGTVDGIDDLSLGTRPAPSAYAETFYPRWHFGWSELKSIRVGVWKYIDAPKPELYDLRADPGEKRNVIENRGALAGGLLGEINKVLADLGAAATTVTAPPQPDAETLARLRSLGYVGMTTTSPSSSARGPDPKDMVPRLEMFRAGLNRALDALGRRTPDAADVAIRELKKLAAVDERSYELHLFLGDAYAAKREDGAALGEYDAAALLNPHSSAPAASQARLFLAQGDLTRAKQKLDAAAAIEPGSSDVAVLRGSLLERQGAAAEALRQYEAAVAANGSDTQARASIASLAMRLRRYDVAKPQFERLLELGYRPSRMHFGLAQIAEAAGDIRKATAEYRTALRLEPGLAEARAALIRLAKP